ncbi:DUF2493 domain-containing protein [Pseudomonas sp. NFXW11]|uniref:DUF2493 domain-containing protein n=1 Tax=Pseudomonas sp. NFXW11 TaxID=2819531 RepID=UPI003CFA9182
MRVLICAGRHYSNGRLCRQVLQAFQRLHEVRVVIHGGSQFLGAQIEDWARETGADIVRYPPNWQMHGKHAERLRNAFMLADSRADIVLALPGGDDTEELLAQARARGIRCLSVDDP